MFVFRDEERAALAIAVNVLPVFVDEPECKREGTRPGAAKAIALSDSASPTYCSLSLGEPALAK